MLINEIPNTNAIQEERIEKNPQTLNGRCGSDDYQFTFIPKDHDEEQDDFTLYDNAMKWIDEAQILEKSSPGDIEALYRKAAEALLKIELSTFDHHFSTRGIAALCYIKIGEPKGLVLFKEEIDAANIILNQHFERISTLLSESKPSEDAIFQAFGELIYLSPPLRGTKALCLFAKDEENFTKLAKKEREALQLFITKTIALNAELPEEDILGSEDFTSFVSWYYALNESLADLIDELYPSYEKLIRSELNDFMKQFKEETLIEIKEKSKEISIELNTLNRACIEKNISLMLKKVDAPYFLIP